MRASVKSYRALTALAQTQAGYFTAKQAVQFGYGYRHLDYHENVGNFERVAQGLYRLTIVPISEHDDLVRLTLWSRNQRDEPQAVVSHESALVLHHLSDILPRRIHLTVPRNFRKPVPKGCKFYKAELTRDDIQEREGFAITTPLRTLLDVAASGVSQEQLDIAVADAMSRGLIRKSSVRDAIHSFPSAERLMKRLK